jgi:hypothetical protein
MADEDLTQPAPPPRAARAVTIAARTDGSPGGAPAPRRPAAVEPAAAAAPAEPAALAEGAGAPAAPPPRLDAAAPAAAAAAAVAIAAAAPADAAAIEAIADRLGPLTADERPAPRRAALRSRGAPTVRGRRGRPPTPARAGPRARAPSPAIRPTAVGWDRGGDAWLTLDGDYESDVEMLPVPPAARLDLRLPPGPRPPPPRADPLAAAPDTSDPPRSATGTRTLPPAPSAIGLFRASCEIAPSGLAGVCPPSVKELQAISIDAVSLLFDARRVAEISRPRTALDDIKAAQYLKAQQTLEGKGWATVSADADYHCVFFGCQVVFRAGLSPSTIALLLQWAVPFGIDTPGDISKSSEWAALLSEAATLYPQLEAEVHACRCNGREFNMPASLFSKIRSLAEAYFRLRATILFPLLAKLGSSALEVQAKSVVRGYIGQAVSLPEAWGHVEKMIEGNALRQHGVDPAQAENAARVTIARSFLIALLQGQTRNWGMTETVLAHTSFQPSSTLLHSTDFARLILTSPAAAALAATLGPAAGTTIAPALWSPSPSAPGIPPRAAGPERPATVLTLSALDHSRGFRLSAAGVRVHALYFSGEYAPPPDWLPPPQPTAPPSATASLIPEVQSSRPPRVPRSSGLCIPTAKAVIGRSSPFTIASTHPCDHCNAPGHAQYECPKRFADTYNVALPGFTMTGDYDASAWATGDLAPAARHAMAAYLSERRIAPHRRFGVTLDHLVSGTAPPPPAN